MNKKLALLTYGCQMNDHDSRRIAGILGKLNYTLTDELHEADVILLNTCSIREKAEQKVFSQLGRLKKLKQKKPETIIGVCGCIAQLHGEKLIKKNSHIDMVLGTHNISHLPSILDRIENQRERIVYIDENGEDDFLSYNPDEMAREGTVKAYVNIMKGCDNFCSYCIVPYTRGRERSRRSDDIIKEIKLLADAGYKEVTLLGQNVNSYGKDLGNEIDFPDLLLFINEIKGIERIRFVTSHPKDMSGKLMDYLPGLKKVCEHIHLPVQSGSNRILKMMNRGYTIEEYLKTIEGLRKQVPGISFSTDIIVGFPGEKDEDFAQTRYIVENIEYGLIYMFKYSPRPETNAAAFTNRIPSDVIAGRFDKLLNIQKEIMLKNHKNMEGRREEVLVEGKSKKDSDKFAGRTRTNKIVNFYSDEDLDGKLVNVSITKGALYSLQGEVMSDQFEISKGVFL